MSVAFFSPVNNTGVRILRTLGGLGSVPDPNTEAELLGAGWNPARIQILLQLGVTNEQLQSLPYPASEDEMTAAYNALTLQLAAAATPPPASSSAQIPSGSQLTYRATIVASMNPLKPSALSLANTIAALQQNLSSQWKLALLNWQDNTPSLSVGVGNWTITLNLQTLGDYGALSDIKNVVDGAFYNAAGASVTSSQISISSLAAPASATPRTNIGNPPPIPPPLPPSGSNFTGWVEQNAGLLIAGIVAIAILPPLIKKL